MIALIVPEFVTRFWSLVDMSAPGDGCWPWLGGCHDEGYGVFHLCGKSFKAHRLAYEFEIGEVGRGLLVCHTCDNPPCVRPSHLFLGSILANNIDKMTKGRHRALRGDEHPCVSVSRDLAAQVEAATGSQREIAARFNVSRTNVGRIQRGEHWTQR